MAAIRSTLPARPHHRYAIRLHDIRFDAHVGVSPEERLIAQALSVNVDITLGIADPIVRDSLDEVLDYDAVVRTVVETGTAQSHRLLETYVTRVVDRLLEQPHVTTVRVAVTKRSVPTTYPVGAAFVELVGHRDGAFVPSLAGDPWRC